MNINPKNIENIGSYYKVLDSFYIYAGDQEDIYVQGSCRDKGIWDIDLTSFMIRTIKPGWKCLDIGANTGYFTEVMARCAGKDGSVIAFEPISRLVNLYNEGKKLNDYSESSPIVMNNFGLSNETKDSFIHIWKNNIGGSSLTNKPNFGVDDQWGEYYSEKVEIKKLSDVYNDTPDFIKIDVEGHEHFVFGGFGEKIFDCPLIVIELGSAHPKEFIQDLQDIYYLNYIEGPEATVDQIMSHQVVNIVMRKK
jgi:FkbM family methyltransferase